MATDLLETLAGQGLVPYAIPGWMGRVLRGATGTQVDTAEGAAVSYVFGLVEGDAEIQGYLDVKVTADGTELVLPLARLIVGFKGLRVGGLGDGTLSLKVDAAGGVDCSVLGDGRFSAGALEQSIAGPGTSGITLLLLDCELAADGSAPRLDLAGLLRLTGIDWAGEAAIHFSASWGIDGLSGSVSREEPYPLMSYAVGWSGGHDLRPSNLMVDLPLPSFVLGPDAQTTGRVRVIGGRGPGDTMDLSLEIIGGATGIMDTRDAGWVTAAALLAACAGSSIGDGGASETAAIAASGQGLVRQLDSRGFVQVTRAHVDLLHPKHVIFDYQAELSCKVDNPLVGFHTEAPMRASVRNVVLDFSGVPALRWHDATVEVGDPGQWTVDHPDGVLQVDKVRSGTGSQWFEVDLRFALDLGPVEVENATVRVTLGHGDPSVSLRGLGVALTIPGLVTGQGSLAFRELPHPPPPDAASALTADLTVGVIPLGGVRTHAGIDFVTIDGKPSLTAVLDVDLPAPIPLGSTGLGLFGFSGLFGLNRNSGFPDDPKERLSWEPENMLPEVGVSTVGLKVAVGTLPDLGHGFAGVGKLAVTTPQLAVVAAVAARLLGPRPSVAESTQEGIGPELRGTLAIIPDELVSLSVVAKYAFPKDTSWKLLSATAPVEGLWTKDSPSDWYVHLGSVRGTYPGPIQAHVLAGILPDDLLRAEAYLMVHGNGIPGYPVAVATSGLVVGAGFDVAGTLICAPAYARFHASADVGVSTHPVFLSGRASVGGSLGLGPFSLGISAWLDLQVGPGDNRWAKVRICGEIDLWLFEISGCVKIEIGKSQTADPDPPPSPIVGITVADSRGAAPTEPADVPTCWPDAVVQIGMAPAPDVSSLGGSFDLAAAPFPTTGVIGPKSGYQASYELVTLQLDYDDGTVAETGIPATWQTKPGQGPIAGDGAAVMSLFTEDNTLWSGFLPNLGASDPGSPIAARRHECHKTWDAVPGWAIGAAAAALGPTRWTLPPRPVSGPASSLDSEVRVAETRTEWPATPSGWVDAGPGGRSKLRLGAVATAGGVHTEEVDSDVGRFPGWLLLPDVEHYLIHEVYPSSRTTLRLADEIVGQGRLVLVTSRGGRADVAAAGVTWSAGQPVSGPNGSELTVWDADGSFREIVITHPGRQGELEPPDQDAEERRRSPFRGVGVVAVGGITATADDNATKANNAKPYTGPVSTPIGITYPEPGPLRPGHHHTVTLTWRGTATVPDAAPAKTGDVAATKSFYVAKGVLDRPDPRVLMTSVDTFHPAMLQRYLRGFRPDGTVPWFTDDAVSAVLERPFFTVTNAYELVPTLVVRTTDEDPTDLPLGPAAVKAETVNLRAWELDALAGGLPPTCGLPHGPVRLSASAPLLPHRAYDVTMAFTEHGERPVGYRDAETAPVAFRTSRWRSAAAMLADAGFGSSSAPATASAALAGVAGPLGLGTGVSAAADGALAAALGTTPLGPRVAPIRTVVVLTTHGGLPAVAGVLIESEESLDRGHPLAGLTVVSDQVSDWDRVADRSGTGILFVPKRLAAASVLTARWVSNGAALSATLPVGDPRLVATTLALAGAT